MVVSIVHQDGSRTIIPAAQYTISGNSIVIAEEIVLSFAATDRININYEPKTMN
jgi:hypothetical protein